jgi:hypothetical protein
MKMRCVTLIGLLSFLWSAVNVQTQQSQDQPMQMRVYDQARLIAIQDFSKTKLYKEDSVFDVTLYDTLYRVAYDTISKNHYRSKRGKAYPDIIAVDMLGFPHKYFLDTTVDLSHQKGIPTRFIEQHGKLFTWWDKYHPLTDSTIKVLEKYHLIGRGGHKDLYKFLSQATDESKQAIDYYFCRSNLSVYKKKITGIAIGYYDPPKIKCK